MLAEDNIILLIFLVLPFSQTKTNWNPGMKWALNYTFITCLQSHINATEPYDVIDSYSTESNQDKQTKT